MDKPISLHVDKPWGRGPIHEAEGRMGAQSSGLRDRGVVMSPIRKREARAGALSSGQCDMGVVGGAAGARFCEDAGKV